MPLNKIIQACHEKARKFSGSQVLPKRQVKALAALRRLRREIAFSGRPRTVDVESTVLEAILAF